jgi:HK97 family phage portal protein
MGESRGSQNPVPSASLVPDTRMIGADGAMQISAVWSCIDRRANIIASLPFFTYKQLTDGQKELARNDRLYALLHDSPNARMTPYEFWRAMMMNYDLRGNAYARLERGAGGEVVAMWPMPSDQVEAFVLENGDMAYEYRLDGNVAILAAANVLHLKNLGNGTTGLAKLEFMRATTSETANAQANASKIFSSSGKPTGILMLDKVLDKVQRQQMRERFAEMSEGNTARLYVLEAGMKYQQLSLSPEQQQLLETRRFQIEEICRWFDVPPILIHHSSDGVTAWGTGIDAIVSGFYKLTIAPMLVNIQQAVTKRVMTPRQRTTLTVEISFDALLRGDPEARSRAYATGLQNGYITIEEVRQLEGWPHMAGTDVLHAQSNLVPVSMLGAVRPASGGSGAVIAQ